MSLMQIDGENWGQPPPDAPPHVQDCFRLRRVPLDKLDVEGLRMLLGQGIGVEHLMPLAIEKLERDPLAKGYHFDGDLLCNVLRVGSSYFSTCTDARQRVLAVIDAARKQVGRLDPIDTKYTAAELERAVAEFERR